MSPIQAMERSYAPLKQMLREGVFAPGMRLEANRLADDLGVSMTPVRDVLHRLVGEGLVQSSSGEGFHVPTFSETALRDLYEWNAALLSFATRTAKGAFRQASLVGETSADRAAALFSRLAEIAPNREIRVAVESASDRLHAFRLIEPAVIEELEEDLLEIGVPGPGQQQAIRRYHLRRMRAVPTLLSRRADH